MSEVTRPSRVHPTTLLWAPLTYDILPACSPRHADEPGGGQSLNAATKYVVSASHPELPWGPSVLIEGDVPAEIAKLKEGDGPELQVHGSGNLIQTLLRHGLVDEFHLHVFPVLLGTGRRLFADGTLPTGLKLTDSKV